MVDRGLFDKKGSLALLDPRLHSKIPCAEGHSRLLPSDFQPGNWDVICHNGKDVHEHIGNRRYRVCIENNVQSYSAAKSRSEKSAIISEIVTSIRESSTQGGGFVRLDSNTRRWYEVGDKVARDKVGQTLRDSSYINANKKRKREVHFAQVLKSTYTTDDPIQPCSKDHSSRWQTRQKIRTEWEEGRVQPTYKWLARKIEPLFHDSRKASVTKLAEGTPTTDPLEILPCSMEDDLFEGECRVGPRNQKQAWKESMALQKSVDVGLQQDDVEWFEADMRAT
eukprot:scaffold1177_cov79-Cylindrotheca_fusiformis.AAC.1